MDGWLDACHARACHMHQALPLSVIHPPLQLPYPRACPHLDARARPAPSDRACPCLLCCAMPWCMLQIGPNADSFYECLFKTWLRGGRTEGLRRFRRMFDRSMDQLMARLLKTSTPSVRTIVPATLFSVDAAALYPPRGSHAVSQVPVRESDVRLLTDRPTAGPAIRGTRA
jgi:hypothetical protein